MEPMREIMFIDLALDDGIERKFPVTYTISKDGKRLNAKDWDDLVSKIAKLFDSVELYADQYESMN